jgi:glycosyltransferase involved in cell wall biosynthesis
MTEPKKIVLFRAESTMPGGMERVMFEVAKYLQQNGIEIHLLTYNFDKQVLFGETYDLNIQVIVDGSKIRGRRSAAVNKVLALRRKIRELNPDIIISCSSGDSMYLYLATLFTRYAYTTHIPQAVSRGYGGLRRHAFIYRKALKEIAESMAGFKEFASLTPSGAGLIKRIAAELAAVVEYLAVRKSRKVFVFSKQMKWEVEKLYRKKAIAAKGAFPAQVLNYKPKQDIRRKLGLDNKRVILSLNRLEPHKKVDLIIRAFQPIRKKRDDAALVIGGTGIEQDNLKNLVKELDIEDRVQFVGFINESELWDYYAASDVFVCAHWADFNITPYGALAMQKKVVWPNSIEVDETLAGNQHIFASNLTVADYSRAMEKALAADIVEQNDLSIYTWERYSEEILKNLDL